VTTNQSDMTAASGAWWEYCEWSDLH